MKCFCCGQDIVKARKVKIRRCLPCPSASLGPNSVAWTEYREQMTYRWNFVCLTCYERLDNIHGAADIAGNDFNLAGTSRGNRARWITREQYHEWQLKNQMMGWVQFVPDLPEYIRNEPDPVRKQALFDDLLA